LGSSPLGSLPFIAKLGIAVAVDFIGLLQWLLGPVGFATQRAYAVVQGVLAYSMYSSAFMGGLAFVTEEFIDVTNAIPTMTIVALWNGYKTGWRR
jgi:hypothetical protein